jgi:hypothetical protein
MNQRSFASAEFALKKKRTRREKFLAEMERIVPWSRLIAIIEPLYPKSGRVGRPPIGVSKMLRMYCLQQWYGLADEALEDALYDSQALRDFVGRGSLARVGAGRDHAAQVQAPSQRERSDARAVCRDQRAPGRARIADARRHHRGRHDHRGAQLNEE